TSVTIAASDRDITLQLVDSLAGGNPFPQTATDVAEGATVDVCVAIVDPAPGFPIGAAQARVTLATGTGSPTNAAVAADFMIPSATLTLDNANRVRCHSVQAVQDAIPEPDQQFFVALNAPQAADLTNIDSATTSGSDTVALNIRDDDEITVGWSASAVTVGEGAGSAMLTAEIISPAPGTAIERGDFNLAYATVDGTATGLDYTTTSSGVITLGHSARSANASIPITQDLLNEADETFTVTLAESVAGVSLEAASTMTTVTITDDDTRTVSIGVSPASAAEGGTATFTVTMDGMSAGPVAVPLTIGGTADPEDRTLPEGDRQVVIQANDTTATYSVFFVDDARNEAAQTVVATLGTIAAGAGAGAVNAGSPNSATAQITDNDAAALSITGPDNAMVQEGNSARFTVTLSGAAAGAEGVITATYSITGDVTAPGDYTDNGGGSVTLPAGATEAVIEVGIAAEGVAEDAEALMVTLGNVQRGDGVGAVTINNAADSAGITIPENTSSAYTIAHDPAAVVMITEGAEPTTYTLVISGPGLGTGSVVMDWAVTATAATGDVDISAADFAGGTLPGGTLTFTASQTTRTFAVMLADDNLSEARETFAIRYAITAQPMAGAAAPGALMVAVTDTDTARVRAVASGTVVVREDEGPVVIIVDVADGITPTAPIEADFTVIDSGIGGVRKLTADPGDYTITGTGVVTSMIDESIREAGIGAPDRADRTAGTIILNEANNFRAEVLFTPVNDNFAERIGNNIDSSGFNFDLTAAANAAAGGATGLLSGGTRVILSINEDDSITVNVVRAGDVTEGGGATEAARIEFAGGVFDPYFALDIEYSVSGCVSTDGCTANPGTLNRSEGGADIYRHRISSRYTGGPAPVAATSVTVLLTAASNNLNEADRAIAIAWVEAIGAVNGGDNVTAGTSAMLAIADDDDILVSITGGGPVSENAGNATLTVRMDHASRGAITVPLTAGGTASTSDDITGLPAQVTIPAGQMSTDVVVSVADDALNEAQETLTVSIGTPAGDSAAGRVAAHGTNNRATITINDNDPVEASITAGPNVEEGDAAVFNIRLNRVSQGPVTVSYRIEGDVTAPTMPGTGDYTDSGMGSIIIPANTDTATLSIPVRADATAEPAETLTVTLTGATGAGTTDLGSPAAASVEIAQSAASVRMLAVSGPAALGEAAAVSGVTTGTYTITLTGDPFTSGTDVTWSVTHGGTEDADFANNSRSGTVRFAANDSAAKTFMVGISDDNLNETTETFTLAIRVADAGADGGTGLPDALPVAITDDDVIEVTVEQAHADSNRNEAANGGMPTTAVFSIALSGGVRTTTVTVPFRFSGDGITSDDFNITVPPGIAMTALRGAVVFGTDGAPAADDTMFVRTELRDDDLNEAAESLTLTAAAAGADGLRTDGGGEIRYAAADGATTGTVVIIDSDPIRISIANAGDDADDMAGGFQVEEGRSARFTVTLSKASAAQASVAYAIGGDVAAADYTDSGGGTLTIAAGETEGEISIALADDEADTSTENLIVTLSATDSDHSAAGVIARSADAGDHSATQAVISRLAARTLRLRRYTDGTYNTVATAAAIPEGDADTTLYFAVDFAGADDADFSAATEVTWTIEHAANGTSATDFTAATGGITHPANTRCTAAMAACRFRVVITGDNLNEPDEGFSVTLSVADEEVDEGTNTGDGSGALTITDDDPITITVTADTDVAEGGSAVLNVNLGAIPGRDIIVGYTIERTTATDDVDAAISGMGADLTDAGLGSINIPAAGGVATGRINLAITDDNLNESAETFTVSFSDHRIQGEYGAATVQSGGMHTFTIAESDPITYGIARTGAATVNEGQPAGFVITLSGPSAANISVGYDVTGSGAYNVAAGQRSDTVVIAAGATTAAFTLSLPIDNNLGDSDAGQTLTVALDAAPTVAAGGGRVPRAGAASAQVAVNFLSAAHVFTLANPVTAIDEADMATTAAWTLTRSGPTVHSGQDLVITWAVAAGGADGADFSGGSLPGGTLTFAAGVTTATFSIRIAGDNLNEPAETFTITFSVAAANQAAADANAGVALPADLAVTINDDDVITYALGGDGSAAEGNPGGTAGEIRLPVTLGGDIALGGNYDTITVPFTIDGGGTAGGGDYGIVPTNGLLVMDVRSGGSLTADIVITAATDSLNEAAETVIINLGLAADSVTPLSVSPGSIVRTGAAADRSATATINDDDGLTVGIARRAGQT
ncbi:MAG: hypothetical protein OXU22_04575, partial [Gammaproteobacteria bacterium]|nr:hypothetical protein [Gammaproteobacteria bacterium]